MQLSTILAAALASLVAAGPYEVSIYASASAYAEAQLSSLSSQCATATGAEATSLSSAYESLKAEASSANAVAAGSATFEISANGYPTAPGWYPAATGGYAAPSASGGYPGGYGNGTGVATPSGPAQQTENGAMATAVPVAMGGVAMAVLGLL